MKRVASIVLILLMSLQCLYKLGVITYFQLNQDYIAQVLCMNREEPITLCHGQCFLDEKLELADDTNADDGTFPTGQQRIDLPIFLISENCYLPAEFMAVERSNSRYLLNTSSAHHPTLLRPPAFES